MKENVKILLVDNEDIYRIQFTEIFRGAGYSQIQEAASGKEAIAAARDYKPHLILMDTTMDGMNGYHACEHIRQEEYGKKMAIVGMSDSGDPNIQPRWEAAGADAFFKKQVVLELPGSLDAKAQALDTIVQAALGKYSLAGVPAGQYGGAGPQQGRQ